MSDVLEELAALRLADAVEREKSVPMTEMEKAAQAAPAPRDFIAALDSSRPAVIAELKRASPSEGMIREDFRPAALAVSLQRAGAAALSVLCEPHRFLGGERYLREARAAVSIPVLYKDFISSRYQIAAARAAGADAVLLIAAVLDDNALASLLEYARAFSMAALVETHDAVEVARAAAAGARLIGVNCRNLRDFSTDVMLFDSLLRLVPSSAVAVAESGMHSAAAIRRAADSGAKGFLVGTALMRADDPAAKLTELLS